MAPDVDQELEEARRELAAAREQLRGAREQLTLFAGQVSHDLRTPLTAIRAHAEMLAVEPAVAGSEDLAWMVDGIGRAAARMDEMIDHVLAYAREGGLPELRVVDLGRLFASVLEDLAPLVEQRAAVVKVGDLPRVPADPDQLYSVATSLLTNALTYSRPDAPPQVEVSAEREDGSWRITVGDNGIGVPEERREAMFVLFARGDRRTAGSGIGLALARRVVEAHGGRMGMAETASGGTAVWFELPA